MRRNAHAQAVLDTCLSRLRELQPVRAVRLGTRGSPNLRPEPRPDLVLETESGRLSYICEVKHGLTRASVENLLLRLERAGGRKPDRVVLFTDYLHPSLAQRLVDAGLNFVDGAGNVFLHWPGKLYVRIQGSKPDRLRGASPGQLTKAIGLRVLYLFLREPSSLALPYREVAKASAVSLGSVAKIVREMREKGFLERKSRKEWRLSRTEELLDTWVRGYDGILRPKLLIGRFQPPETDLDQCLPRLQAEAKAAGTAWAVTGGFAADLLVRHFRGDRLTVFLETWSGRLAARLGWLPSAQGPVTVLRHFSPFVAFTPPRPLDFPVAHPLLVYAELLHQGRERELEAARLLHDRYLAHLTDADRSRNR